jgi:hypothetical protein
MSSILILLALSALSGFALASYFSWPAILVAGVVLPPFSAIVLQNQGLGALSTISVIVLSLTINQVAYLIGGIRANEGPNRGSDDGLPINKPTASHATLRSVQRAGEGKRSPRSTGRHVPARARRLAGVSGFLTLIRSHEGPNR